MLSLRLPHSQLTMLPLTYQKPQRDDNSDSSRSVYAVLHISCLQRKFSISVKLVVHVVVPPSGTGFLHRV